MVTDPLDLLFSDEFLMCVFSDAIDLKERSSETLDFRRPFYIKPSCLENQLFSKVRQFFCCVYLGFFSMRATSWSI